MANFLPSLNVFSPKFIPPKVEICGGKRRKKVLCKIAVSNHVHTYPPLDKKNPGKTRPFYILSSPHLLSRHRVGRGSLNRQFRMWQLSQKPKLKYPKKSDEEAMEIDLNEESQKLKEQSAKEREKETKGRHRRNKTHQMERTLYLSPYEYEHRILDQINARRGLNPRPMHKAKSYHTTYEC